MADDENHPSKRRKVVPITNAPNFSDPTSLVTFIIGPDAIEFKVHKEFVCAHSSVLRAAFNGPFIEGQTQTYTIDDTSIPAFRFFVLWIYRERLDVMQLKSDEEKDILANEDEDYDIKEDQALAEAWILGDKFAVPALQNYTAHVMIQISNGGIAPTATFPYIYDNTHPGSVLRSLVLAQCYFIESQHFKKHPERYPVELLRELACFAADVRNEEINAPTEDLDVEDYLVR